MSIRGFLLIFGIGCLIGYILLIIEIRVGFYLISALFLILGINTAVNANANQCFPIMTAIDSIIVLFAVLQIKKDGKSCWQIKL